MYKFKKTALESIKSISQLKLLLAGAIYFVCGFIISCAKFPMSVYPLGIALISSSSKNNCRLKMYSDFSFYSLCIGCTAASLTYSNNGVLYFTMCCALFFIRFLLTGGNFSESRAVKIVLSLSSSLCIGFVSCAINVFRVWEMLGILILAVFAPVFTYLFDTISDNEKSHILFEAGCGAYIFALLYGIREMHIFSFSVSMVVSAFTTICIARKKGPLYGALCGLLCGLAGENFILPPVLGIMGFSAGILFKHSDILALLTSYISGITYGIYCSGFDAVGYFAPEFLIACIAVLPVKKLFSPAQSLPVSYQARFRQDDTENSDQQRLIKISDAFSALSEIALESEKDEKPNKSECRYFVKRAFEQVCDDCMLNNVCQLNDKILKEGLQSHLSELLVTEQLRYSQSVEELDSHCRLSQEIVDNCLKRYNDALHKSNSSRQIRAFSGEYNTMSKLLKSTVKSCENRPSLPEFFKLKRVMDNLRISYKFFDVKNSRHSVIDIVGIDSSKIEASSQQIRNEILKECGFWVNKPEIFTRNSTEIMRITRTSTISLEFAKATRVKNGEEKNGDRITVFEKADDFFYLLLCDGMGSGREAAAASRIAGSFIEKLIVSSSPEDITIEMLNNFLISKDSECFSTIDLLEIDKLMCQASFIKAGAAPSFIIRNGSLHKISSNTPPAGIIYNMTAEKTVMKLEKNDIIVMLSDGIMENGELAPRLMELFTYELNGTAEEMAHKIMEHACEKHSRSDDMSVAIVKIT